MDTALASISAGTAVRSVVGAWDITSSVGRPVPGMDIPAGPMIARNTLVRAVKG